MNLSELRPILPPDGPNALLDAALAYARAGWRVFPVHGWRDGCCTCGDPERCDNPAKHPLTSHGLHDATVQEAAIRRWWAQWPDANVAIRAEDIGVVVDVDPRNGGTESLDRIFAEHGGMPDTVEVLTGGGGQHFYLRAPHPVTKGKLPSYPGIDIQASGSYVIAPPSVHKSGRRYEFEASSDWTAGQVIAECPAWILKLRGEAVPRTRSDRPVPALSDPSPAALADLREALRYVDPDLSYPDWVRVGQAIHGALWTCGFQLWDEWSAQGSKYPGTAKLWRKWNSFDANGALTLATVYGMARDAGRQWKAPEAAQDTFTPPAAGESMLALVGDITQTLQAPQWLVRKYFEFQTLGVLFGEPGAGKSFLALDLGLSVATGRAWHGHKVRQTPVIYICGEGFAGLQRRAWAWKDWHQADLRGAPFALTRHAVPMLNPRAVEMLCADVDRIVDTLGDAPGFFIIDTLARNFGGADENATKDMNAFVERVTFSLMNKYQAGTLVVHHTGHGDKQRSRGSSALKGAVDAEYCVSRQPDGTVELAGLKMKDAPDPPPMRFSMRVVDLPIRDEEGETVTSLVPVVISAAPVPPMVAARRGAPRGGGDVQRACLDVLVRMLADRRATLLQGGFDPLRARVSVKEWQQAAIEQRLVADRKRFFDRRESLEAAGLVRTENGFAYPMQEGTDDAQAS